MRVLFVRPKVHVAGKKVLYEMSEGDTTILVEEPHDFSFRSIDERPFHSCDSFGGERQDCCAT